MFTPSLIYFDNFYNVLYDVYQTRTTTNMAKQKNCKRMSLVLSGLSCCPPCLSLKRQKHCVVWSFHKNTWWWYYIITNFPCVIITLFDCTRSYLKTVDSQTGFTWTDLDQTGVSRLLWIHLQVLEIGMCGNFLLVYWCSPLQPRSWSLTVNYARNTDQEICRGEREEKSLSHTNRVGSHQTNCRQTSS